MLPVLQINDEAWAEIAGLIVEAGGHIADPRKVRRIIEAAYSLAAGFNVIIQDELTDTDEISSLRADLERVVDRLNSLRFDTRKFLVGNTNNHGVEELNRFNMVVHALTFLRDKAGAWLNEHGTFKAAHRPKDDATRLWCKYAAMNLEWECGILLRNAQGSTNSKAVALLARIWELTLPLTRGRSNDRSAIQRYLKAFLDERERRRNGGGTGDLAEVR